MSHYYPRWCAEHGDYDADVDGHQECEQCVAEGKTPMQVATRRIAELEKELAETNAALEHWQKYECAPDSSV